MFGRRIGFLIFLCLLPLSSVSSGKNTVPEGAVRNLPQHLPLEHVLGAQSYVLGLSSSSSTPDSSESGSSDQGSDEVQDGFALPGLSDFLTVFGDQEEGSNSSNPLSPGPPFDLDLLSPDANPLCSRSGATAARVWDPVVTASVTGARGNRSTKRARREPIARFGAGNGNFQTSQPFSFGAYAVRQQKPVHLQMMMQPLMMQQQPTTLAQLKSEIAQLREEIRGGVLGLNQAVTLRLNTLNQAANDLAGHENGLKIQMGIFNEKIEECFKLYRNHREFCCRTFQGYEGKFKKCEGEFEKYKQDIFRLKEGYNALVQSNNKRKDGIAELKVENARLKGQVAVLAARLNALDGKGGLSAYFGAASIGRPCRSQGAVTHKGR